MKKQFENKEALLKWVDEKFPQPETEFAFDKIPEEPYTHEEVAAKLLEEGYDLDDLTANGEAYEINGHTNNGWFYVYKEDLAWLKSTGADISKVRVRD